MNYRFIASQLGLLLIVISAAMAAVAVWGAVEHLRGAPGELPGVEALAGSIGVGLLIGGFMWWYGFPARRDLFGRREALLLVALSWLVSAALAALPYWLWGALHIRVYPDHPFTSFIDCYFEAMSGLTTTGATVLGDPPHDIEGLPRSLLLWRALTQWLGGLGIVVLFVAVLPSLGVGGKKLFMLEMSGPTPTGVRPRIADTARVLWFIYLALTGAQIIALRLCGLTWFDALCHTLTTLPTGGFSTHNASIGTYGTAPIIVFIVFMILGGVNFGLFYRAIHGNPSAIWKDTEFRVYISILVIASTIIVASLYMAQRPLYLATGEAPPPTLGHAIEQGVFTTVSIQTTTGYATGDSETWPFLAKAVLITVMFIGGSAGSTSGGIKVIRIWIAFKILLAEVERVFKPNVVRPLRLQGSAALDPQIKMAIVSYVLGIIILFAIGTVAVKVLEGDAADFATAASASVATICVVGPGFGAVGATQNYGWMSPATKMLLSLWMVLGRLEVFPIFVLCVPSFWRRD